jgi:hypothetical protein
MQKCIDASKNKWREHLLTTVIDLTPVFVRNPFGNYVVREVNHDLKGSICA